MATPKRSTADLLRWSEDPVQPTSSTPVRPQPTSGIASILLGTAFSPEEAEALAKKKQNSELKKREMSGSGIFSQDADSDMSAQEKAGVRPIKPTINTSQISFGVEGAISPKKPTSIPEVAKQRELSGNLEVVAELTPSRKPTSTAKVKELVGSNIFAPPPDVQPRSLSRNFDAADPVTPTADLIGTPSKFLGSSLAAFGHEDLELSVKKSNASKVAELTGHNIFKDDAPSSMMEKTLSAAKRKEISGNDIFADEKPVIRDHLGGIRKPPGGESSLTLV